MPLTDTQHSTILDYAGDHSVGVIAYFNDETSITAMNESDTVMVATIANALYRAGEAIMTDHTYDNIVIKHLTSLNPDHAFLHGVEAESLNLGKGVVMHPSPMLSTNKVYTFKEVENTLFDPIKDACLDLGIDFKTVLFRMTPKLDGLAGRDDGKHLVTRGDGSKGSDVTRNFDRGLKVMGVASNDHSRGQGVGEIVVLKSYFEDKLSEHFVHPRNFMTGLVKADNVNEHAAEALQNGAAVFMPYVGLPSWNGTAKELTGDFESIVSNVLVSVDSFVDGAVLEVDNADIKHHLGATKRHHRWQVAIKQNTQTGITTVKEVISQVGRTGKITPVLLVEPIHLSGATISRVTAHHYGMVKSLNIGKGAIVELVRSGEVIPKLIAVKQTGVVDIPDDCPSCGHALEWESDFLRCPNTLLCTAQQEGRLGHWFETLGNVDGFGPATISRLVHSGIRDVSDIFSMVAGDFLNAGFGAGETKVLLRELDRCKNESVEDWRFLGAFGVHFLGRGASENLLENATLNDIFNLSQAKIQTFDGFGEITAKSIVEGLARIHEEFNKLMVIGFNLVETASVDADSLDNFIVGKNIVFTGKMVLGSRDDMKKGAKLMGAKVQSSVNSKTDFLICGENVGAAKSNKARDLGVTLLTEAEYIERLA
jgi:DNA ligase (NAD+)